MSVGTPRPQGYHIAHISPSWGLPGLHLVPQHHSSLGKLLPFYCLTNLTALTYKSFHSALQICSHFLGNLTFKSQSFISPKAFLTQAVQLLKYELFSLERCPEGQQDRPQK